MQPRRCRTIYLDGYVFTLRSSNFPQHRAKTLTSKEGWPRVNGILTQIYNGRKFVRGRVNVSKLNFYPSSIINYALYLNDYLNLDKFKELSDCHEHMR